MKVIPIQTGTARMKSAQHRGRDGRSGITKEVVVKVAPFEEIGFRLQEIGLDPARDIAAVVLTHFHHDHTGGLDHFPHTRIIAPRESWNVSRGFQGKMAGCLPQRWPIWLKPELVDIDGPAVGPFPHSHPITKDGRIFLVATPGHSKGHVSVVARGEGVSYFWQATPHMMKPVCEMNSRMGLPTNRHSP